MANIFLSSVYWSLAEERKYIYDYLKAKGHSVFAFNEDGPTKRTFIKSDDFSGKENYVNTFNENVCLEGVMNSDIYVGIFKRDYGSSYKNHTAGIALTDLELFSAIKYGKRLVLYIANYDLVSSENLYQQNSFATLLSILESFDPSRKSIKLCDSKWKLYEYIQKDFQDKLQTKSGHFYSLELFSRSLVTARNNFLNDYSLQIPRENLKSIKYDLQHFPSYIDLLSKSQNYHLKLDIARKLLYSLSNYDNFDLLKYPEYWNILLDHYRRASGWIGLHGPLYLTKYSADTSIIELKLRIATNNEIRNVQEALKKGIYNQKPGVSNEWGEFYQAYESLASEYYSISRMVGNFENRIQLLRKAYSFLAIAEHSYTISSIDNTEYGFYNQKANILFELGDIDAAINYFNLSTNKRLEKYGVDSAEYGESLAYYGYAKSFKDKTGFNEMFKGMEILEGTGKRLVYLQRIQGKTARQLFIKGNVIQKFQAPIYLIKAYSTRKKLGLNFMSLINIILGEIKRMFQK